MKDVKFGLTLSSYAPKDYVRIALRAEKYGFDSIWLPDHLTDIPYYGCRGDPWTILSMIGARTKHITLWPCVTDTQRRHPSVTANIAATLDELTDGRAGIAIGAGEAMNIKPFGLPWEDAAGRVERLGEAIQVIKLLLGSSEKKPVDFHGTYFNLDHAYLLQHSAQPHLPVYVGSFGGRRALKIVGKYADGWFPWMNTVETFKNRSDIIREASQEAGRSFEEIERAVVFFVAASEDEDLQKRAREATKTEALILTDPKLLKKIGFEVPPEYTIDKYQRVVPTQEMCDLMNRVATKMPDEVADKFIAVGDAGRLIERINEFIKAGARHIALRDMIGEGTFLSVDRLEETLQLFHRKVIPYFRGASEKNQRGKGRQGRRHR